MCLVGQRHHPATNLGLTSFLVQVMTRSFIQKHEAGRLSEVDGVFASLSDQGGGPGALPLSQALAPDSPAVWLWAEAQFYQAAKLLAEEEGKAPVKSVFKLAGKQGGSLKAADLVAEYPVLADWLMEAFEGGFGHALEAIVQGLSKSYSPLSVRARVVVCGGRPCVSRDFCLRMKTLERYRKRVPGFGRRLSWESGKGGSR